MALLLFINNERWGFLCITIYWWEHFYLFKLPQSGVCRAQKIGPMPFHHIKLNLLYFSGRTGKIYPTSHCYQFLIIISIDCKDKLAGSRKNLIKTLILTSKRLSPAGKMVKDMSIHIDVRNGKMILHVWSASSAQNERARNDRKLQYARASFSLAFVVPTFLKTNNFDAEWYNNNQHETRLQRHPSPIGLHAIHRPAQPYVISIYINIYMQYCRPRDGNAWKR